MHRDARASPSRSADYGPRPWSRCRCRASARRRSGFAARSASQRASTTFCWLPPERLPTAWSRSGHADAQQLAVVVDAAAVLCALVDEDAAARLIWSCAAMVILVRIASAQEQRLLLAVFGHEADAARASRPAGPANVTGSPSTMIAPAIEPVGAENRARGLGAAGADEPGEAEDLALMRAQRDVDQFDRVRIARGAPARQALDLERDRPGRAGSAARRRASRRRARPSCG